MATLEVRIKYHTWVSRMLFWLLSLTMPLWGFMPVAIWICNFFVGRGFFEKLGVPIDMVNLSVLALGGGSIPLFIVGLSSWLTLRKHGLVLSQQGIVFPLLNFTTLWAKRNRAWYELSGVRLLNSLGSNNFRKQSLRLDYKGGGFVILPLSSFSLNDLEQLLLGIETFATSASGVDSLPRLKNLLRAELKVEGIKSYTNLWEDELRYRYASTTFIPLTPGSTLQDGKIKVIRQLGFGGLSAIYLVQRDNKELAILKESVLPADVEQSLREKAEEQFEREARILAGLNHPRIAGVLDYFVERGHYLLLEYIHGQDLRQYVNERGAVPESRVLEFAFQIAEILEYLHGRETPIIHRDLTPENLIVNDKGNVVLIDFGAANEFLHTATGTLVGKHAYMAPEQLKGRADAQSDLYALGGTLFFLLCAKDPVPLSASHPAKVQPSVSEKCDELVSKLTQMDKNKRFASASELKQELSAIMGAG